MSKASRGAPAPRPMCIAEQTRCRGHDPCAQPLCGADKRRFAENAPRAACACKTNVINLCCASSNTRSCPGLRAPLPFDFRNLPPGRKRGAPHRRGGPRALCPHQPRPAKHTIKGA